jgi:hypothetical protein
MLAGEFGEAVEKKCENHIFDRIGHPRNLAIGLTSFRAMLTPFSTLADDWDAHPVIDTTQRPQTSRHRHRTLRRTALREKSKPVPKDSTLTRNSESKHLQAADLSSSDDEDEYLGAPTRPGKAENRALAAMLARLAKPRKARKVQKAEQETEAIETGFIRPNDVHREQNSAPNQFV